MKKFLLVATVLVTGVAPASAQNLDARQSGLILANFPWCEERPAELKNALCPELWMITSGSSGATSSSQLSVGSGNPFCSSGSQPLR